MGKEKKSDNWFIAYNIITEKYADGTIFMAKDIGEYFGGTLTSLYNDGYLKRENTKSPFKYSYTGKVYEPSEFDTSSSQEDGYTKHTKHNNQYFGWYMEDAIVSIINKKEIVNNTGYPFTEKDMERMNWQAYNWVQKEFPHATKAVCVGRHTMTADCDIIINDTEHVELKYVSEGNGTYLNTSLYYFTQFGFNFHDYMEKMNYFTLLKEIFGNKVNMTANSPISQDLSSDFRKKETELYKNKILPADKIIRKTFVDDLVNYFKQPEHYDDLQLFGHQMLTKETLTSQKRNPDYVSVYGYKDNKIRRIYPNEILKPNEPITITQEETIDRKKEAVFSIKLNNIIRVQIGWQNGTGLNNPTIRVFIEKGVKKRAN